MDVRKDPPTKGRPLSAAAVTLLVAAALFLAAACDDAAAPAGTATPLPSPTPVVSVPPTLSPAPTTSPAQTAFAGGRDPVIRGDPAVPPVAVLIALRFARHDGFDRVVFEFRDNVPGYRIEYVQPPILGDASGEVAMIAGSAFLRIRFTAAQAHDDAGVSTISGREFTPGLPQVKEIESTGDFEGVLTWVAGLSAESDFRVTSLSGPTRVVIDIAHP